MSRIEMPDDFYEQTPDANVRATEAVMNTMRTADMLFDRIGQLLRPLNVSAAGGLVLGILRDHGRMPPSALGERLIVTRATVTGVVDSLERRGFVRRVANPADRRSLLVEITPAGTTVLQELRKLIHRNEKVWMGVLSETELLAYVDLLHRIQDGLEDSAAGVAGGAAGGPDAAESSGTSRSLESAESAGSTHSTGEATADR